MRDGYGGRGIVSRLSTGLSGCRLPCSGHGQGAALRRPIGSLARLGWEQRLALGLTCSCSTQFWARIWTLRRRVFNGLVVRLRCFQAGLLQAVLIGHE